MTAYAELAVTTNYSFLRGASHPQEMVATADELGYAAIGIADRNSFAGVVRAYGEWKKREKDKARSKRSTIIRCKEGNDRQAARWHASCDYRWFRGSYLSD
jgi:DNA polymerase III alpha subunit